MLNPGDPAPTFIAPFITGGGPGDFDLSPHLGDPMNVRDVICLALVSHSLLYNPACEDLLNLLEPIWNDYGSGLNHVQVVAVSCGTGGPDADNFFLANPNITTPLTFPVVQETDNTISDTYDLGMLNGTPQLYIIDRNGLVYYRESGALTDSTIRGQLDLAIYHRDPVNIEFVSDVSGSMNDVPIGSTDTKLDIMKTSAQTIVSFLAANGQATDNAGLVTYASNADAHGGIFYEIHTNSASLNDEIGLLSASGYTAMGAGLQTAFGLLNPGPNPNDPHIFLLTDGMQNRDPMLWHSGSFYEISNNSAPCGASTTTGAPGFDVLDYNTRVYSIGVGITGTWWWDLYWLSIGTGGVYHGTNDPITDLPFIYQLDLCHSLAGGSPTVIHHNAGIYHKEECRVVESFEVNRSIKRFTATLSWEKALDGDLSFWLRAPDGTLLDLHKEMQLHDNYAMATVFLPNEKDGVKLPYVGQWEMIIGGVMDQNSARYNASIIGEDPVNRFAFDYRRKIYEVGDIVPLTASLTADKQTLHVLSDPIDIILEHAVLPTPVTELLADYQTNPKLIAESVAIYDDKVKPTPLELKLESLANDPDYKDKLIPIRKSYSLRDGSLECKITDDGIVLPVMLTQPGLNNYRITVRFGDEKTGPIMRTSMVSVQVDPGQADPEKSIVKPFPMSIRGFKGVLVHATPRNAANQLLGPGLSEKDFEVRIGRSSLDCEVKDNLDGSYLIKVPFGKKAPSKSQTASLTLKGQPLWKGKIEDCIS